MRHKNSALRVVTNREDHRHPAPQPLTVQKAKLAVRLDDGVTFFNISDILRCEADSNYCHIHLRDASKFILSKTLGQIMDSLPGTAFIRVHQSHVINISSIKHFGNAAITLDDGSVVPVSRRRRAELLHALGRVAKFL